MAQRSLQAVAPFPQQGDRSGDSAGIAFDAQRGFVRTRELRTTEQLRDIYQFPSIDAVRMWMRRHHVPFKRRGRIILADLRDVDAVMDELAGQRRVLRSVK